MERWTEGRRRWGPRGKLPNWNQSQVLAKADSTARSPQLLPGDPPREGRLTLARRPGELLRGCPEQKEGGGEMKGRCPNCNRQPISNALAASISEPASHGSRLPAGQGPRRWLSAGPTGGCALAN